MNWISAKNEKFRQVPDPYFSLLVTAKSLVGVGLGVLLATWLPVWTWWIFIIVALVIVALVIAIPSVRIVLSK